MRKPIVQPAKKKITERVGIIIAAVILTLAILLFVGLGVLAKQYEQRVMPTLRIGDVPIGGVMPYEVAKFLGEMRGKLLKQGVTITAELPRGGLAQFKVYPAITLDLDVEIDNITSFGKSGTFVGRGWQVLASFFTDRHMQLSTVALTEADFIFQIKKHLAVYETPPQDAKIHITSVQPLVYEITTSSPGVMFNLDGLAGLVNKQLAELESPSVRLDARVEEPRVTEADVNAHLTKLPTILAAGPVTLTHYDSNFKREYVWKISTRLLADWLTVVKTADVKATSRQTTGSGALATSDTEIALDKDRVNAYFTSVITPKINVSPQNAKFVLGEGDAKVTEFVPSRPGVTLNTAATYQSLQDTVMRRVTDQSTSSTLTIVAAAVPPQILTADTNTLGIKEVLGVGLSNFSGSPRNRILNIKNAVRNKLHGTLVAPGEEFSLVNTLKPYTLEAGYLPELVIKGDRITPEIAGGLCQVGTTMFRATMHSGLPVTARTNHGLVVSYYNDPANGNPGTDATIYEPWPDFRFRNDTGSHIMITTEMNTGSGELAFTIWGTPDGRRGYYTPPKVLQWIPAGVPKTIETTSLPPGKKECQGVHNGAIATFNYIRVLKDGSEEKREFKSTYRSVPATCYVGVEKLSSCPEDEPDCPVEPLADGDDEPIDSTVDNVITESVPALTPEADGSLSDPQAVPVAAE